MRVVPFIRAVPMRDKGVELDGKIEHYQHLSSSITDQAMLEGIKQLIERMKAQKAALHPEQTGKAPGRLFLAM
jgi:hypothetical protein